MSETHFELDEEDYKDGYVLVFDSITNDSTISDAAYRLLVHLHSNSDTWKVYGRFTAHLLGWGKDKMTRAIRELYNLGFITRTQVRNKGEWGHFIYKVSFKKKFKNPVWELPKSRKKTTEKEREFHKALPVQASQPERENPSPVNPGPVIQPLPMPNKPMPNKPKAMKALPSSISSSKALAASQGKQDPDVRGRRHKRPEAQEETFQWLLGLDLTNEKGVIDDEVLSVLAHTFTRKKLEDTYAHFIHKLEDPKLKIKKSKIAFYRHLLNNEHDCRGTNSDLNAAYARKFSKELQWGTLEIKDKYVIDRNNSAKDISLNMDASSFRDCLGGLYMSLHGNFGT
jgi:predicted transcriptional regulator